MCELVVDASVMKLEGSSLFQATLPFFNHDDVSVCPYKSIMSVAIVGLHFWRTFASEKNCELRTT